MPFIMDQQGSDTNSLTIRLAQPSDAQPSAITVAPHADDIYIFAPSAPSEEHKRETDLLASILRERRNAGEDPRLKVKNRRKRYLDLHPEYLTDPELELADPLLYDRAIRRFKTTEERQEEGVRMGAMTVSANILHTEEKAEALSRPIQNSLFGYNRGENGEILPEDEDEKPLSREEGKEWWTVEMTQRFLRGDDEDFDYKLVDNDTKYDDPEEERDRLEAYFDEVDEHVVCTDTGIQDY